MISNALFWLVSINKGIFLKKQVLNQNVQLSYFWLDFHKNWDELSTKIVLTTQKISLCYGTWFWYGAFYGEKDSFL